MSEASSPVYLAQQPILDRDQQLVAYELLFRTGVQNYAQVTDDFQASAHVIVNVLSQFGVEQVLGDRRGFINVNRAMLLSDALELLPPQQIVLELLETIEPTPEIIARCHALHQHGFTLALDDFVYDDRFAPLLEVVDIVKFDLTLSSNDALAAAVRRLDTRRLTLLAEKVETQAQFQFNRRLGFSLFQGYYFARPTLISGRHIAPRPLLLLRLISLLLSGAEILDVENNLKQDPNLTVSFLRLANSAAVGLSTPVQSLRQALVVLGQRQTLRWVQLLLYADQHLAGQRTSPLMSLAATRGRFLELLATQSPALRVEADRAFVVGILSLLDALLGVPMEDALRGIPLAENILAALQRREGPLGAALALAEAIEKDQLAVVHQSALALGVTLEQILALQLQAGCWARAIEKSCD
jgi:c-di-GMP-related signal transduction protein